MNWALPWQNKQNECAPREDSDQTRHQPSLIRVFAVHLIGSLGLKFLYLDSNDWSSWAWRTATSLGFLCSARLENNVG